MPARPLIAVAILLVVWSAAARANGQTVGGPSAAAQSQSGEPARAAAVDKLFAAWDHTDTPGCMVAVLRDGTAVYQCGYGMADLGHEVRIGADTVFNVASVTKQFTAFCVHKLAQEGRLSLDDDVRKHVPELHDFGPKITLRHLLNHTSGLRDYFRAMSLAGWRYDDPHLKQDVLDFIWRQGELNFPPGEQYDYCNTGYVLLALIVERITGRSFADYATDTILRPLGMNSSRFGDDYERVVRNAAESYYPIEGGFHRAYTLLNELGDGGLLTTAEDLAKWDANFYDAKVGGRALLDAMQQRGRLRDGTEIAYASGLAVDRYRGLRTVEHSGGIAGFRADILRFPDRHLSVILLANAGDFDAPALARRVAELYLGGEMEPAGAPPRPEPNRRVPVAVSPKLIDAYVGDYRFPGYVRTFIREGDHLVLKADALTLRLYPASATTFFPKEYPTAYTFDRPIGSKSQRVVRDSGIDQAPGDRIDPAPPSAEQLAAETGRYYSEELATLCTVAERNGGLEIRLPKHTLALKPIGAGSFAVENDEINTSVRFIVGHNRSAVAFLVDSDNGRLRNLRFTRIDLRPPHA
ncbi:MAG TPA: serine hydrolase [Chthonomonadaceae bacterium]|nr:serine hydrolase [Chthonomonadaceae bacterium]